MSGFREYDNYLSKDFSRDYWADDAIDFATELAEQFMKKDWHELKITWRNRSILWQERCSQSISLLEDENATQVLEDMLTSSMTSIALLAVEGLQANDKWLPKTYHLSVLKQLSKKAVLTDLANIKELLLRGS